MKVSLSWLKDYVDISVPAPELAHKLTMAGAEVDSTQTIGGNWENVLVADVLEVKPHPNADRLRLATVNLGAETITVVCGAPNVAQGQKVAFARVGAVLKDGHTGQPVKLKPAKIRGVVSEGMICAGKELGISDDYEGIMVLPPDAPVGRPLSEYLGDTVFDLKVTPNRPDCLSVIGVAREAAALTARPVRLPDAAYKEAGKSIHDLAAVEIVDAELCLRYCASLVTGIKIGPSPQWMQQRLTACGMRPINNIVDITNYVMLEYGQPLHAFDCHKIGGGKIVVRRARPGETITTLDGASRQLDPDMLVIADVARPIALAGVMGGAESEVTEGTTSILLESANFYHKSIRRTSSKLRLRSEASARFDKMLSAELPLPALQRATALMVELAGGEAAQGIIDIYPGRKEPEQLLVSAGRINRLLGTELPVERMVQTLGRLGFVCRASAQNIFITVPYWRTDVRLAEDVVEEIARTIGYDELPATQLRGEMPRLLPSPMLDLKEKVRDQMVGCGLQEIITYSLVGRAMQDKINPEKPALKLANPMSLEQEYLRTSIRGGLLAAFAANARHEDNAIKLFETGKVYLPRRKDLPEERETLAGVLGGPRFDRSWYHTEGAIDFFDAKGIVETLLRRLYLKASYEPAEDASLLGGRSAKVIVEGQAVGVVGEVHPKTSAMFDISRPAYLFEIDLEKLVLAGAEPRYQPVPRFPGNVRDIAVIVDVAVAAAAIESLVRSFPLVSEVSLFDIYEGEQVPKGKKSLAFSIRFQSLDRTLSDEEVNRTQQEIVKRLERDLGAALRG